MNENLNNPNNSSNTNQNFDSVKELMVLVDKNKEKLEKVKNELEKIKEVVSLVVLPPLPEKEYKDKIFMAAFIDDINIEGEKLPRINLIMRKIEELSKKLNVNINAETVTEVWTQLNEGNFEKYNPLVLSHILFDKKFLVQAIKVGFVHRDLIKKQFEKYMMSYVLFGSVAKMQPREDSDIDFAVVIDDTDLKEISRYQAKEQLMQIFYNLVFEAKKITGVDREIHLQVYLLTEIWDSLKEANPIIVNFIRDSVVFYDNGIIIPWKRLLELGKIKPTPESIDSYFKMGEELENVYFNKLKNLVMEDFFWATITPAQAVIMALGYEPPYPKNIAEFVKFIKEKEGVFEDEDIEFLKEIVEYRKGLEHGTIKSLDGKTVDELKEKATKFFSKMKKLYREIILKYREKEVFTLYERVKKLLSLLYGIEQISLIKPLINKGIVNNIVSDYLDYLEEYEKTHKINEENAEILWKVFKIILRDLEKEFEKIKKEKLSKLITKGKKDDREVVVLFLKEGIGVSEEPNTVKVYYYDGKEEELPFNVVFEKVIEYAENLEDVPVKLEKLAELGIELIF